MNKLSKKTFIQFISENKVFIMFMIVTLLSVVCTFAEEAKIEELDNWGKNILGIFTSGWVKAILLVALIIEAIAVVIAGQQGGGGAILKKFGPWIIGTIILVCANSIGKFFYGNIQDGYFKTSSNTNQTQEKTIDTIPLQYT